MFARVRRGLLGQLGIWLACGVSPCAWAQEFEAAPKVTASDLLEAGWISGEHHTVNAAVNAEKGLYLYTLRDGDQVVEVHGTELLKKRIREIYVIADLDRRLSVVSAGKGLAGQGVSIGKTFAGALKKPVQTIVDIPKGFIALGKRSAGSAESKLKAGGNYTGGALQDWYQISEYKLKVAGHFGVDPYTDNETLQKQLTRLASSEAAGGIGLRVLIPGDGLVAAAQQGGAASVLNDVYETPPTQLYQENQKFLTGLGLTKDEIVKFLGESHYNPADQSLLVRTVASFGNVNGIRELIAAVSAVESQEDCHVKRVSAEMLKFGHEHGHKIASLHNFGGFPVGATADKTLVVPIYLDQVYWNQRVAQFVDALTEFQKELGCVATVIVTPAKMSERTKAVLATKNITVLKSVHPETAILLPGILPAKKTQSKAEAKPAPGR
jgi:hypothetical protein